MPAVRALLAAVSFLTRVPVGRFVALTETDVARGAVVFPVVGAAVGAAGAGVALLLAPPLSPVLAAGLGVAAMTGLSGAFHLDGLADTFDATGGATRDRSLEIMRDSRIGTFGATAVALALLIRVASVAQLLTAGGVVGGLISAGAVSRGASVAMAAVLPYARQSIGTGGILTGRTGRWGAPVALAIALGASGLDGLAVAGLAATAAIVLGLWFRAWIGGVTGDTLGATSEIVELVALVTAAALA